MNPHVKTKARKKAAPAAVAAGVPHAKSQRDEGAPLDPVRQIEKGGGRRTVIRYVRVTCAPLDSENFTGSTKGLTDCLRTAFPEWIPDDSPEYVIIEHVQRRCATHDEEGTLVELFEGTDEEESEVEENLVPTARV